jgi:hypothetical protein
MRRRGYHRGCTYSGMVAGHYRKGLLGSTTLIAASFLATFVDAQTPTTSWNGSNSTNWFTPRNWSEGVPNAEANASVTNTTGHTTAVIGVSSEEANAAFANSLTIGSGNTVSIQGGGSLCLGGTLTIKSGGTFISDGHGNACNSNTGFSFIYVQINNSGNFISSEPLSTGTTGTANVITNNQQGIINVSSFTIGANQVSNFGTIVAPVEVTGGTLTTTGMITGSLTNSATVNASGIINGAITNQDGGVFTVTGNLTANNNPFANNGMAFLNVNGPSGTVFSSISGLTNGSAYGNMSTGGVNVALGNTLSATSITNSEGAFMTNNGGTLTASSAIMNFGTLVNNNSGPTVGVINGGVSNSGTFSNFGTTNGGLTNMAGTTTNSGTINGPVTVSGGTLNTTGVIGGALTNSATVNASGTINGAITNQGSGVFTVTGNLTANNNPFANNGTAFLNVNGPGGTVFSGISGLTNGSTYGNISTGGVNVAAGNTLRATSITNNAGAFMTNNGGTLTASSAIMNLGTLVNNNRGPTVGVINGGVSNSGTFSNVGTTNGGLTNTAGTTTNSGTINGNVMVSGGTLALTGSGTVNGGVTVNTPGTFNISNSTGVVQIIGLSGNGSVGNGSTALTINGGTSSFGGNITGSGLTTVKGADTNWTLSSGGNLAGGVAVTTSATFNTAGVISGALSNSGGTVNASGGSFASLTNTSGGIFNISGAVSTAGAVNNNSTLNILNGGNFTVGGGLTNTGAVNAQGTINGDVSNNAGNFTVTGPLMVNGAFTNASGASLLVGANTINSITTLTNGGTIALGSGSAGGTIGAGTVNNNGVISVSGNSVISGAVNNAGTISFTAPSQSLTTGNFASSPGSTIALLGSASQGNVDRLIVNGTASGTVALNLSGVTGICPSTPATVIQTGGGSLRVTSANGPAGCAAVPIAGGIGLVSTQSVVAAATVNRSTTQIEQTIAVGIEQHIQQIRDQIDYRRRLASSGSNPPLAYADDDSNNDLMSYASTQPRDAASGAPAMFTKARPTASPPPSYGVWLQGFGDIDTRSIPGFEHTTYTAGVLGGVDKTWFSLLGADDALVLGLVSNYASANVNYSNSDLRVNINGPGIGGYGTYIKGAFSVDATAKVDFFDVATISSASIPNSSTLYNYSLAGNTQYKLDITKNIFFEPTIGFIYTYSQYADVAVPGVFNNGYDWRAQAGGRFGSWFDWNSIHFSSSLQALAYDDVKITGTTLQNVGLVAPSDEGKTRGQIDGVLDMDFGRGLSSYLRGEIRFGEDLFAYAFKGGIRYQW